MASADSWKGPFRQTDIKPIDRSQKNIDPFLFRDDDGKYYLYHVRFGNGNFIWVAEFNLAKGEIIPGTLKKCMESTEEWEATAAYISAPVMEGPTVIKLDGVYYLFYSANDYRSLDYAVGYATSNSPMGPWTKNENSPIIHRSIVGENGSGTATSSPTKQETIIMCTTYMRRKQTSPRARRASSRYTWKRTKAASTTSRSTEMK